MHWSSINFAVMKNVYEFYQRKHTKMQWLQDSNHSTVENLNHAWRGTSRHFRNKKKKYLKTKSDELKTNSKSKSVLDFNNCFPTRCDLFSLLLFCRQFYMFRVLTPIIRSSYNCNYNFWCWLTGSTTIRLINTRSCIYSCTSSWWCVSTPETCRAAYRKVINWIQSHPFGKQLLNSIHDARTDVYVKGIRLV